MIVIFQDGDYKKYQCHLFCQCLVLVKICENRRCKVSGMCMASFYFLLSLFVIVLMAFVKIRFFIYIYSIKYLFVHTHYVIPLK